MKKNIFLLLGILGAELVIAAVLLVSFSPMRDSGREPAAASARSRDLAAQNTVRTIKLKAPEKDHAIQSREINELFAPGASPLAAESDPSVYGYLAERISGRPLADAGLRINAEKLGDILLAVAAEENRPSQNAELEIKDGRAVKFIPHRSGQALNLRATQKNILAALDKSSAEEVSVSIAATLTAPKIKLGDLNEIGVRELVARGESDFSGSSRSRVHNISVGAARYDGLIIKPGEEFSFNKHLGPVTASAGFLPELVIKPEGTVPEYGGGLCQVSTTAFRAAFFGGLDITQRKNHSYAVKYYVWINDEIPPAEGLDATIYPGAVDMKFINDTASAILIDTHMQGTKLYFDFFGTPDERQVIVEGPNTYDRRASGALKASVTRTVINGGEKQEKVFLSNYVSPNLYPRTYELQKEKPETPAADTN